MKKLELASAVAFLTLALGASGAKAQMNSGFYVRGDVGGAFSTDTTFEDTNPTAPNSTFGTVKVTGNSGNSVLVDAGAGFRFSPLFRADLTLSYIPSLRFSGSDNAGFGTSNTADIKSLVGMVNGYLDLAALAGMPGSVIQPFLVGSAGLSRNELGTLKTMPTGNTISGSTRTEFAWGVGAGVGIPVARNVTIDVMYKYLDLGEVRSSSATSIGTRTPIKADLQLHTVTAGVRLGF